MHTRRQSIQEGCHTVPRRSKRLQKISESENGKEDSLPLPMDLMLEIFSRLSAKSLAICRCVSKPLATVLRRPDFTDLFSTKSSARPQILIACRKWSKKTYVTYLFSVSQPQNADEYSSPLVVNRITHIPLNGFVEHTSKSFVTRIGGLLGFVEERYYKETRDYRHVFYNPSTGRSLTLPSVKMTGKSQIRSYFGYDPVEKLFKAFSMTVEDWGPYKDRGCGNHKVLTLGSEKPEWRMIECGISHIPIGGQGICINGILYYQAYLMPSQTLVIVCFDVRSEKFCYFEMDRYATGSYYGSLIVYNNKLALLQSDVYDHYYLHEDSTRIELIVIGDFEKQEWSKHTYILPPTWKTTVGDCVFWSIRYVGVTPTNEIVLSSNLNRRYLFFYNMEMSTFTRVEIKGMNLATACEMQIFMEHVEDLKLLGG